MARSLNLTSLSIPGSPPVASMIVSKQCNLQDILSRSTIPNNIGILLDTPLTIEDAKQLADALDSLAKKIDVSRYSLALSCRCSREQGIIVAKALHCLRELKNIALVLNSKPGPASDLARSTIRSLQDNQEMTKIASLMILPREIRRTIIDHVFNVGYKKQVYIASMHYSKYRWCCRRCMPARAIEHGHCACYLLVGGYSTSCFCNPSRFALFRVNKLLYAESTFVFFSTNRVRVTGIETMIKFFSNLPDDALCAMRMIDLRIGYFDWKLFFLRVPQEFATVVSIICEKCNLKRLHISIDTSGNDVEVGHWPEDERHQLEQMHMNIVLALKPLAGVNRLDIYVTGSPKEEESMERQVMGDDYNAYAKGKLHMFERDPMDLHELG